MANLITLSRLLLLILIVAIAYQPHSAWQIINVPLLILVFVTDGLDGYVARKRNEASLFGAMFDIAGDRIVELTMWIVLADLDMVPIWVPLIFVIRGIIVDTIRASGAEDAGQSPFDMMQTDLGRWLVAGKFMRIFYAVLKAVVFCWLLLIYPIPTVLPAIWADWGGLLEGIGQFLVYVTVLICLLRGLPVVIEFVYGERESILGRRHDGGESRG
ncbi:MAG: CDP-alcohol phosphatidyltransferase family protein [Gammaproteobacteria bacterium]|nr:CDP-alcohol phosphatidyltransferase family protein [Gammaproteobacteria bacterium]